MATDFVFLRKPNLTAGLPKAEDVDVCFVVAVSPRAKELAHKFGWQETAEGNGQYHTRFETTRDFLEWLGDMVEEGGPFASMAIGWPDGTLPPHERGEGEE
jgi:hypothetical protein